MGMALDKIQQYADLREQGESTSEQRKHLLEEHVIVVEERIEAEALHLERIKQKIHYYAEIINS